jgi:hypothetical protein
MNIPSRLQEALAGFLCRGGMAPENAIRAAADSLGESPIELKPTALEESEANLLATWSGGRTTLAEARRLVRRAHPEGAFFRDVAQPRPAATTKSGPSFIQESATVLISEIGCGHVTGEAY